MQLDSKVAHALNEQHTVSQTEEAEITLMQLILQDIQASNDVGKPYELSDMDMAERYKCSPIDSYNAINGLVKDGLIEIKEHFDFGEELEPEDREIQHREIYISSKQAVHNALDKVDAKLDEMISLVIAHSEFYYENISSDTNYHVPMWMHRHKHLQWSDAKLLSLLLLNISNLKRPIRAYTKVLADALHVSERTVYRSIKRLEKYNLLVRKWMSLGNVKGRFLIPNMEQIKLLMN